MKHWAQFYERRGTDFVEPCGDRSIIQIDARLRRDDMRSIATHECAKRKYDGYRLMRGDSLLRLTAIDQHVRVVPQVR